MINEIPKSDFHDPTTRPSSVSGVMPVVPAPVKHAPRPLRDVSRDATRDTLPDLGPDADQGFGERDTDVDPVKVGKKKSPADNTEKKILSPELLSPEILVSEGYGPTPGISAAASPERPDIEVVEGGIPEEIPSSRGFGQAPSDKPGKRTLGDRAQDARSEFEAAVRENPVRAVGLAAGAGFAAGAALFATPVVRVLVGGIASVALQSDGAKRIYGHIGTGIVERLEGLFTRDAKG